MLNSLLSKASRSGTNEESSNKDQPSIEESNAPSTLKDSKQVNPEATGTYPSPGSSPYNLDEGDDAPVLVVHCPSTSSAPHVHVVDGSLTYDNLQTPTGTNDDSDKKAGHGDNNKKMDDVLDELLSATKKGYAGSSEDESLADKPFADSVIVEANPDGADLIEEGKDPLLLSLLASDLDISAIKDLTLTTPPDVSEIKNNFVPETKLGEQDSDKRKSDLNEDAIVEEAKLPKPDNETVQSKSKETILSKTGRLHGCASRRLLLLCILLGTSVLFCGVRHTRLGTAPASPTPAKDVLTESEVGTLTLEGAPTIGSAAVTAKHVDSSAHNTTHTEALADTLSNALVAEEQVIPVANTTAKLISQEETKLDVKRSNISVSVATNDDTSTTKSAIPGDVNEISPEFPTLKADDTAFCDGSHWGSSMSMPQLVLLAILLLATTSMFGSRRSKEEVQPKDEPINDEYSLSPQAKKELESYDLSKYSNGHSFAQLREKLRARKCNTTGKKHKLVQRLAAVYKAELETLTVVQLRKILKSKNFTQYGTKAEIIRVLVEDCP